ncbi:MAG: hypothetical protein B7Z08_10420 [Sphingomonadales bacterium 32-68-7]|nr:MAG: hypothetical protein B7Z08_10420 [Sphingomonadales bacterium 32-68-7]
MLGGRLFNLVPLAIFIAFAFFTGADRAQRNYSRLLAVMVLVSHGTIERFAQHRAFFIGVLLVAALVIALQRGFADRARAPVLAGLAALAMGLLALFNYPSLAAGLALLGAAVFVQLLSRRFAEASWIAAAALTGLAIAAVSMWNSYGYERVQLGYWVSAADFALNLAAVGATAVLANLAASAFALRGGMAALRGFDARAPIREWRSEDRFALCLALSILFAFAGFALINFATHAMAKRQLVAVVPLIAGLIANLALRVPLQAREYRLIVLSMVLSIGGALLLLHRQPSFRYFAPELAAAQAECPGYTIHPVSLTALTGAPKTLNARHQDLALDVGYDDIARRYRLTLDRATRGFDARCGGAIWMESAWIESPYPPAAAVAARIGFTLTAQQAASASLELYGSSLLIRVPPDAASAD